MMFLAQAKFYHFKWMSHNFTLSPPQSENAPSIYTEIKSRIISITPWIEEYLKIYGMITSSNPHEFPIVFTDASLITVDTSYLTWLTKNRFPRVISIGSGDICIGH